MGQKALSTVVAALALSVALAGCSGGSGGGSSGHSVAPGGTSTAAVPSSTSPGTQPAVAQTAAALTSPASPAAAGVASAATTAVPALGSAPATAPAVAPSPASAPAVAPSPAPAPAPPVPARRTTRAVRVPAPTPAPVAGPLTPALPGNATLAQIASLFNALLANLGVLAQGTAPTLAPTPAPTVAPTPAPTLAPTPAPPPASLGSPVGRFLYAVDSASNTISQLTVNQATGVPTFTALTSLGSSSGSFMIAADPAGRFLFSLNSNSLDVTTFTIAPTTGALTFASTTPGVLGNSVAYQTSGGRSLVVSPNGAFLIVNDVGRSSIASYAIGATGTLALASSVALPYNPNASAAQQPQVGHLAVDPTGTFVYAAADVLLPVTNGGVIYQLSFSSTTGALALVGSPLSLPTRTWDMQLDPSGAALYVVQDLLSTTSAGGLPQVAIFSVLAGSGTLTSAGGYTDPNGFVPFQIQFEPNGAFACLQGAGSGGYSVESVSVNGVSGALAPTGVPLPIGSQLAPAVGLVLDASGSYGYCLTLSSGAVSTVALAPGTGVVSSAGSPAGIPVTTGAAIVAVK